MNRKRAPAILFFVFFTWLFPAGSAVGSAPYYTIQGGSYRTVEAAERHVKSLQDKGYEAVCERVDIPRKGKRYRIYIGRYVKKDVARQVAADLKVGKLISTFRIRRMMLPVAEAVIQAQAKKTKKPTIKRFDTFSPAIDLFPKKLAKARSGTMAPKPDIPRGLATPHAGEGSVGQGRLSEFLPALSVAPATEQKETDPPSRQEGGSVLYGARKEFKAQRYDRAASMLQVILNQPSLPGALKEQTLRMAADCYYFLGLKGDAKSLLTAVEQYKTILISYPDPAVGNDLVYYHLAKSNEKLSFLYESSGAWDRLISTYPASDYLAEAMFKLGAVLNQMGKYNRATERLLAYLKKYPAGEYARTVDFMLGDCYYLLHKEEFAGQRYDEARKKWPDFHDIPAKTIINMGNHYFTAGKFSLSLQIFSLYYNIYPAAEFGKSSLYMMARNAAAMGETAMALRLYSIFSDRYPTDSEAETCLLAMAALGVAKPGIKYPFQVLPIDAYRSPLKLLDSLLAKTPGGEKEAAILLLKGDALVQDDRIKEGFAAYQSLLSRFPRGRSSEEGRKKLKLQARPLVEASYEQGDYLAVADIYFQGYAGNFISWDDFATASRIGKSLLLIGLYDDAAEVYGSMQKKFSDREQTKAITLALAKIDLGKNRGAAAEEKLSALLTAGGTKDQVLRDDIKITLADLYYKNGLLAKANSLYAEVLLAHGEEQGVVYRNYGRSLQGAKLSDRAIVTYLRALKDYEQYPKSYPVDILVDIYGGLGTAYYDLNKYKEGIGAYRQALARAGDTDVRNWLTCMIGKGSLHLKDFTAAEKSFAQLKANAVGEFWPRVADYVLEENRLAGKVGYQNE